MENQYDDKCSFECQNRCSHIVMYDVKYIT